jgi:Leucine-rich repeat (LRR) protein
MKISSITGYHHYQKKNVHVERIEFMSMWSSHLPNGFGNFFPNLAEIEVRETPLRELKRSNFEGMSKLIVLSIEDTKLSLIADDTFDDLVSLQELTIRKSLVATLSPKLFFPLKNLRAFDGKSNKFTRLESDLFTRNSKIESINFSGNVLRDIAVNFTSFENIIEVYFFNCGCIDAYFFKTSAIFTLKDLQKLINKKCSVVF